MGLVRDVLRRLVKGRPNGLRSRVAARFGRGRSGQTTDSPVASVRPEAGAPARAGFVAVLGVDELDIGEVVEVMVSGVPVALVNADGAICAVEGTCPHAGGPLGDGTLDGDALTCPWHGWSFDVRTGACHVSSDSSIATRRTLVADGRIYVSD